jgi:hypothetical protein
LRKINDPFQCQFGVKTSDEPRRFQPIQTRPTRCRRQVHQLRETRFAEVPMLLDRAKDANIRAIKT